MKKIHLIVIVLLAAIIALQIYIGFFKKETQQTQPENTQANQLEQTNPSPVLQTKTSEANPFSNAKIEAKILPAQNNTWGYEISINSTPTIRQLTIPGIAGNKGFKTKAEAQKVIDLVIKKIKKNIMPPTIQSRELDSLKININ